MTTNKPPKKVPPQVPSTGRLNFAHVQEHNTDYRNRTFDDMNAADAVFVNCDFSFSIFNRAYLKNTKFEDCKFTGCRFYDSNFRSAKLYLCDLRYANFYRTLIDIDEILANLPKEANLRRELLQNLRGNAVEIGDYGTQKPLVLAEVAASMEHWRGALRNTEGYYKKKYGSVFDRISAAARLAGLTLGGLIWGHGERPTRLLASASVLLFSLTLINFWAVIPREGWWESAAGLKILIYNLNLFLDFPVDFRYRGFALVDYALVSMRYLYIGLFISVVFKSISHR